MEQAAKVLRRSRQFFSVDCAYLEITPPSISDAIDASVQKGAKKILVLPYFLLMGNHVKSDIPRIVSQARKKYRSQASVLLCPYLGYHKKIVSVMRERLKQAK